MINGKTEKKESQMDRADRVSREYITEESNIREKKTAKLRNLRLEIERISAL